MPAYDGKDYIKELADTVEIEDLSADGIHLKDLWVPYLKKWLVASVATVLGRGNNHTCLILVGAQGKGKTTWLNIETHVKYVNAVLALKSKLVILLLKHSNLVNDTKS